MNNAEAICKALEYNLAPPDKEFIAAAGRDYGMVRVWRISDSGDFAIKYGDNGSTHFDISQHVDVDDDRDIGEWLLSDDLDGADRQIALANIFGLSKLEEADASGDEIVYAVLVEHDYYGGVSMTDAVREEDGDIMEFESFADAKAWIQKEESHPYVTQHNETGRPRYKIVAR